MKNMGIGMIFRNIKIFITSVFLLMTVCLCTCNSVFAIQRKAPVIVVLSDTGHRNGTTYLICGAASDIIASDIINKMNQTGRINAPLLGENMSRITQRNIPLYYDTFFKEYKYNYNVDFVNLKRVTRNIPADYVLMVTSGLDIQSQLFKETWWNKWGISSSQPIEPTYKLITMLTLVDKKTYRVVWQDLYQRDIKAQNMDLGVTQFAPNYSQLAKIKKYSNTMSEYVTAKIDEVVNPWILPPEEPKAVEMKSRFINEGTKVYYPTVNGEVVKQNFNEFKTESQMKWENYQRQRMQKKNIENVRRLERKNENAKIRQQEAVYKEQKERAIKKKNDERLFDSIRNGIEDVSNTLPPAVEENENIKPAVDVKTDDVKIIQPVLNPYGQNNVEKNITPAVNKQNIEQQPVQQYQQQTPAKNRVPSYDWNLKNIYLQKIGKLSNLN